MKYRIWKFLSQILFHRNDLAGILKPVMTNLNNCNINNEEYIPFLKTFSKCQLEVLCQSEIISVEIFNSLLFNNKKSKYLDSNKHPNNNEEIIEGIISEDKIKELQEFILEKDIKKFNTITKSFNEVEKMSIPLIHYCVIKNALECFKYLLVNGYSDLFETMKEQNTNGNKEFGEFIFKYKWDCMALAIYKGSKIMMKILEEKGIEKGTNSVHLEAAILSYRNSIVQEIIEEINEKKKYSFLLNILENALLACSQNNNIKGCELLILKGADIRIKNFYYEKRMTFYYSKSFTIKNDNLMITIKPHSI